MARGVTAGSGVEFDLTTSSPRREATTSGIGERALAVLEFPHLRERLAALAHGEGGKRLARALRPAPVSAVARARLESLHEAKRRFEMHGDPPGAAVADVAAIVARARDGRRLSGADLCEVLRLLEASHALRQYWAEPEPRAEATRTAVAHLLEPTELSRRIRTSVGEDGGLLDTASRTLGRLRSQAQGLREAARERIEQWARRAGSEGPATLRDERFVVPVRADRFERSQGIVQDVSSSGATFFVEPFSLVALNNEWRQNEAAMEEEERRILDELTAAVAAESDSLASCERGVAELDELAARVRLSRALAGTTPSLDESGERLHLRQGRHPILWLQEGGASDPEATRQRVVGFDLDLRAPARIVLVSGPNMGGKTVLLKAVGLAAVMALSGLDVCAAEGAVLPVVREAYADIGDEQSIQDHLSTFAGRLRRMNEMAQGASPRALCLLDELGSGTDPEEGTALGRGLLEHLAERGAWVIATTHLGGLKVLASECPAVVNASLAIDPASLQPLYELQIGVAGGCYGLATARRLGLAPEVLARAEAAVRDETRSMERLLEELAAELKLTRERAARLAAEEEAWERRRVADEAEKRESEQREREKRRRRVEELRALEARGRELVRQAEREWRKAREEGAEPDTKALRTTLRDLAAEVDGELAEVREAEPASRPVESLEVGARVRHKSLGLVLQVVEGPRQDGSVVLARGAWKVTARPEDLSGLDERESREASRPVLSLHDLPADGDGGWEVDLRGAFVEEALHKLDDALDRAILAGHREFRVIHGIGSGALARAVARHLGEHPQVKGFRLGAHGEGGRGVTVAELA